MLETLKLLLLLPMLYQRKITIKLLQSISSNPSCMYVSYSRKMMMLYLTGGGRELYYSTQVKKTEYISIILSSNHLNKRNMSSLLIVSPSGNNMLLFSFTILIYLCFHIHTYSRKMLCETTIKMNC